MYRFLSDVCCLSKLDQKGENAYNSYLRKYFGGRTHNIILRLYGNMQYSKKKKWFKSACTFLVKILASLGDFLGTSTDIRQKAMPCLYEKIVWDVMQKGA